MHWNRIARQWPELSHAVKARWLKLSDRDVADIGGMREAMIVKVHDRYGIAKFDAEKQVNAWTDTLLAALDKREAGGKSDAPDLVVHRHRP